MQASGNTLTVSLPITFKDRLCGVQRLVGWRSEAGWRADQPLAGTRGGGSTGAIRGNTAKLGLLNPVFRSI